MKIISGEELDAETVIKINNLIKTAKQIGRAEENTNPDTNIKFVNNEETFEHIKGYLDQTFHYHLLVHPYQALLI